MTLRILACIALFAVAMLAVRVGAHGIVDNFGALAGVVVILLMYIAALHYERRQTHRGLIPDDRVEVLPPNHWRDRD